MAYTLEDLINLNPNYKKRYDPNTQMAYLSNMNSGKEISFKEGQGQQYGLGGLQNDSHIVEDPNKLISSLEADKPKHNSLYSPDITRVLNQINSQKSSYNPSADTSLQQAQQQAMDETSRVMARKGMLFSDSNKAQMNQSAQNLVPQYEQMHYNRQQNEKQDLYNQLDAYLNLENRDYNRSVYADETAYSRGRDIKNDINEQEKTMWERSTENPAVKAQELQNQITYLQVEAMQNPNSPENQAKNIQLQKAKAELDQALALAPYAPLEAQAKIDQIYENINLAKSSFNESVRQSNSSQDLQRDNLTLQRDKFEYDKELAKTNTNLFTPAQQASNYNTVYNNAKKMLDDMRENLNTSAEYGPPNPETGLFQSEELMYEGIIRTIIEDPRLDENQKVAMLNQLGIPEL